MGFPARGLFRSRYVAIALTAVLGSLASIGAFLWVLSWEHRVAEIDFRSKAKSYLEMINADLGQADTLLSTMGAYIEINGQPVSRQKFRKIFASVARSRCWASRHRLVPPCDPSAAVGIRTGSTRRRDST